MNDESISKVIEQCEEVIKLAKDRKLNVVNIVGIAEHDSKKQRIINFCISSDNTSIEVVNMLLSEYSDNVERIENIIKAIKLSKYI